LKQHCYLIWHNVIKKAAQWVAAFLVLLFNPQRYALMTHSILTD